MANASYRIGKKIGPMTNEHHLNIVRQPRGGLSREAAAAQYEECEFMAGGRTAGGARKRSASSLARRAARSVGEVQ